MTKLNLDCVYIAACERDARLARICVASVRYFYPDVPIKLLAGGPLEQRLQEELARYWDVRMADIRAGDWGWGFVKLEPLFGPPGERFLVLDSDTAFVGSVLGTWADSSAEFLVDNEQLSEADIRHFSYDWRTVATIDPAARPQQFYFNSGQWFGTAGVLRREDFAHLIDWSGLPPKLRYPDLFMSGGEQGVLNYVLNQKSALDGISVARGEIMRWPGKSMKGLDLKSITERRAPPLIAHWAGMRKARVGAMVSGELLLFFENFYYDHMPAGKYRRILATCRHYYVHWRDFVLIRVKLRYLIWRRQLKSIFFRGE